LDIAINLDSIKHSKAESTTADMNTSVNRKHILATGWTDQFTRG